MIIKTKEFTEVCKTLNLAVDNSAANLELLTSGSNLCLNLTNRRWYTRILFTLESPEPDFRAVIDAKLFLDLVSGITTETFDLSIKDNIVIVKSGKSTYKLAMIYDNDKLMELPIIKVGNKTVEMNIKNDILQSILNVNGKELVKVKNITVNELQKLYYITEEGCFNFSTGSCKNSFKLDKPVKLLLTDEIVKLFKLFKANDIYFSYGIDTLPDGSLQTKATFETPTIYLAAIINNDNTLIDRIQGPVNATENFINEKYCNHIVVKSNDLAAAISRLMLFTKNSINKVNMLSIPATFTFTSEDMTITDELGNTEVVAIQNDGSIVDPIYSMIVNLADIKLVLDSCKDTVVTIDCGNHRSVIIARNNVTNLIPESRRA